MSRTKESLVRYSCESQGEVRRCRTRHGQHNSRRWARDSAGDIGPPRHGSVFPRTSTGRPMERILLTSRAARKNTRGRHRGAEPARMGDVGVSGVSRDTDVRVGDAQLDVLFRPALPLAARIRASLRVPRYGMLPDGEREVSPLQRNTP